MIETRQMVKATFQIEVEIDEKKLSDPHQQIVAVAKALVTENAEIHLVKKSEPLLINKN